MVASLSVIFAVACVAALIGKTAAYHEKCINVKWGSMTDNVHVETTTIEAGNTNAILDANPFEDCFTTGVIAIACDSTEEPIIHKVGDFVLVRRRVAKDVAKFALITFCDYLSVNSPNKATRKHPHTHKRPFALTSIQ